MESFKARRKQLLSNFLKLEIFILVLLAGYLLYNSMAFAFDTSGRDAIVGQYSTMNNIVIKLYDDEAGALFSADKTPGDSFAYELDYDKARLDITFNKTSIESMTIYIVKDGLFDVSGNLYFYKIA